MSYSWKWFRAGRMQQGSLTCGADIAALAEYVRKKAIKAGVTIGGAYIKVNTKIVID